MTKVRWVEEQTTPLLYKYSFTGPSTIITALICKSSVAPMMFVPLSERSCLTFPPVTTKRLKAFIKDDDDISSRTSIWTPRLTKDVKRMGHHLETAAPLLFFLVRTSQGQQVFLSSYVNGGPVPRRSGGKFSIIWHAKFPRSFLQFTQLYRKDDILQEPAFLIAPDVIWLPWCWVKSWKCLTRRVGMWYHDRVRLWSYHANPVKASSNSEYAIWVQEHIQLLKRAWAR